MEGPCWMLTSKNMSFMMKGDGATLPISLCETLELELVNQEFIG